MNQDTYSGIRRETRRMIDGWEGRTVDFKLTHAAVTAEDLVALANAQGGTLLVGVEEVNTPEGQRGRIVGCDVSDRTRNAIVSRANGCTPPVQMALTCENMKRPNRQVMRIDVPQSGMKPHCTQGGTYKVRIQGQNAALLPQQLLAMFLEREGDTFLARFRQAALELMQQLEEIESSISGQLVELDMTVQQAVTAADEARAAAAWAGEAAELAAAAAEDTL